MFFLSFSFAMNKNIAVLEKSWPLLNLQNSHRAILKRVRLFLEYTNHR